MDTKEVLALKRRAWVSTSAVIHSTALPGIETICQCDDANCTERARAPRSFWRRVGEYQERVIKSGQKYAFFKLETRSAPRVHVASAKLDGYREVLTSGEPLLITHSRRALW